MSNVATSEIEDARSLKISSIFFLSHEEMEGYNFEGDEIDLKKNHEATRLSPVYLISLNHCRNILLKAEMDYRKIESTFNLGTHGIHRC